MPLVPCRIPPCGTIRKDPSNTLLFSLAEAAETRHRATKRIHSPPARESASSARLTAAIGFSRSIRALVAPLRILSVNQNRRAQTKFHPRERDQRRRKESVWDLGP